MVGAEVGYGVGIPDDTAPLLPYAGVTLAARAASLRVGGRLELGSWFSPRVGGEHGDNTGGPPERAG